jgi:hypothetical protein
MNVDVAPRITVGSRYVFILAEAMGADGDQPLASHEAKFAWPIDAAGMVTTVDGVMSIDELTSIVRSAESPEPLPTAAT